MHSFGSGGWRRRRRHREEKGEAEPEMIHQREPPFALDLCFSLDAPHTEIKSRFSSSSYHVVVCLSR